MKKTFLSLILLSTFFCFACGSSDQTTSNSQVVVTPVPTAVPDATDAPGIQAGIVISTDGVASSLYYITPPQVAPTALDALNSSGASMITHDFGFGIGICSLLGVGYPENHCFGDHSTDPFWAFYSLHRGEKDWTSASVGPGDFKIQEGDVIGFVWTVPDANFNPVLKPPFHTFDEISQQ